MSKGDLSLSSNEFPLELVQITTDLKCGYCGGMNKDVARLQKFKCTKCGTTIELHKVGNTIWKSFLEETTNREKYLRDYNKFSSQEFFDVIYLNERDEISEGTITNIFVQKDDNWFTPPVSSGILNGCYREYLLNSQNNHSEMIITKQILLDADKIKLTNSLRKEIVVSELWLNTEEKISYPRN